MRPGDLAIWFLFKGQAFDVARVLSSGGELRGFYVDALSPVRWNAAEPDTLEPLDDLYLDLWVWPDYRCATLDEDELALAELHGRISRNDADLARSTIWELVLEVKSGTFPPAEIRAYDIPPDQLAMLMPSL